MAHNKYSLAPGTVIAVWVGFIRHVGIVTDRTYGAHPSVISNSHRAGGVIEEPLPVFSSGQDVDVVGYPGSLPPQQVLQKARSRIGETWDLFWNCEHFVKWAHGLRPRSPQLVAGAILMCAFAVFLVAGGKK